MSGHKYISGPWISTSVAAALLVAGGAGYRLLAAYYSRPSISAPISASALSAIPLTIGQWQGVDEALDQYVIQATDTDQHVNRIYSRTAGESVALFIGYGVNLRDLAPHRPDICYPAAGWTAVRKSEEKLTTSNGSEVTVQLHRFQKGGLLDRRVTVLNYYLVDGAICPDVSLLRSKSLKRQKKGAYAAQIQIMCSEGSVEGDADRTVMEFAAQAADHIRSVITSAVHDANFSEDVADDKSDNNGSG